LRKKSPEEMKRAKVAKATRSLIRLKHSLAADEEINDVLPDRLEELDRATALGTDKALDRLAIDLTGE